jgi:hypothetical protein
MGILFAGGRLAAEIVCEDFIPSPPTPLATPKTLAGLPAGLIAAALRE